MSSVLKIVLKEVGKKNGPIKNRNNETEKRFKERERANGRVKESLKEEKERKKTQHLIDLMLARSKE